VIGRDRTGRKSGKQSEKKEGINGTCKGRISQKSDRKERNIVQPPNNYRRGSARNESKSGSKGWSKENDTLLNTIFSETEHDPGRPTTQKKGLTNDGPGEGYLRGRHF